ncbi:reverse transcriptase family protein [Pseudarthrobacter sp. J64]|uniref:reverse transcriptase family protein n=1 Tax=Pseudarthrobacter sp. J64 TaxID=3116485 RepID=UPI002E8200CB|nr:reverse transcriptase family protein [Pseudarthrobacter sp. J64]MEE2569733.1 reverse transcriptase family protein [Pseudarthrobacter sp. J64]
MEILPRIRSIKNLMTAASLPEASAVWLNRPLDANDVHVHTTRKPKGGYRTVCSPLDEGLLRLQKRLKEFIDREVLDPHPNVHGYTRGRGATSNALAHLNARAILTVDIKDFFPSIDREQVEAALHTHGAKPIIAEVITNVSTFRDSLATGFPASPVLSNLVFRPLDDEFATFAAERELVYTRYADDLTFSGARVGDEELQRITDMLLAAGFEPNRRKVRFQRRGHMQVVTGLTIGHSDRLRLPKARKKNLRQDLYFAGKNGFASQARYRNADEQEFREQLLGRINYLMGVEPELALQMRREFEAID